MPGLRLQRCLCVPVGNGASAREPVIAVHARSALFSGLSSLPIAALGHHHNLF